MAARVTTFVFIAVACIWCAIYLLVRARRVRLEAAVQRRVLQGTREGSSSILREGGKTRASSLEQRLAESGLDWTPEGFLVRMFLGAILAAMLGGMLGGGLLAFLLGILGGAATPVYARHAYRERIRLIDEQMPRALELMAMSLRAGHSLSRAVALAAEEAPAPISEQLMQVSAEHELGSPLAEVFGRLADRFEDCEAINTFVVALLVLERSGGNLIAIIDRIVDTARARVQYRARLNALTSQGRSSARLLGVLPGIFALFTAAMDPAYIRVLIDEPAGNTVLFLVLALWGLGLLWTRRIARPEW